MSIRKRDRVYWTDFTRAGERFRKSLECHTLREAKEAARELQRKVEKGLIVANPTSLQRMNLSAVLDEWLLDRKLGIGRQKPLSEKTMKTEAERAIWGSCRCV